MGPAAYLTAPLRSQSHTIHSTPSDQHSQPSCSPSAPAAYTADRPVSTDAGAGAVPLPALGQLACLAGQSMHAHERVRLLHATRAPAKSLPHGTSPPHGLLPQPPTFGTRPAPQHAPSRTARPAAGAGSPAGSHRLCGYLRVLQWQHTPVLLHRLPHRPHLHMVGQQQPRVSQALRHHCPLRRPADPRWRDLQPQGARSCCS